MNEKEQTKKPKSNAQFIQLLTQCGLIKMETIALLWKIERGRARERERMTWGYQMNWNIFAIETSFSYHNHAIR